MDINQMIGHVQNNSAVDKLLLRMRDLPIPPQALMPGRSLNPLGMKFENGIPK